jgi:NAD(P)-dependent dehydrogenase (short-subunit alcohol dehydrogenase family)
MVESFMINAVGPLLMIQALNLANGAKCVNITSRVGSIADNTSGGLVAYRTSKTALNMITKNLSIEMPSVTFIALHPGYIRTGMTRGNGDMDPEEAVERMNVVINSANKTGAFLHRDGHELPW